MGSPSVQKFGHGDQIRALAPPEGCPTKRLRKLRKASSTTGKSKGLIPSPMHRMYARRNRSYKYPQYEAWCNTVGKRRTAK